MLATLAGHPLNDPAFVYEPKYDGIRAIVAIDPARGARGMTIWSRLGNDKTSQFPEVVRALAPLARRGRKPLVLDGEIVALDGSGHPVGFQQLQGRIHLTSGAPPSGDRVAFIAFDLLREGSDDLCAEPFVARRRRLERVLAGRTGPLLRISEQAAGDGRQLFERALSSGAEGLIAKRADSAYHAGRRSPDWIKLKIAASQEFVVGGWTEPRGARSYFGALLLGVYEDGELVYVGHTGTGFDHRELARVWTLLESNERPTSPFRVRPKTNERPHWVEPVLVAEVKFTEWTADGKLRHPTYLGLRDDVDPKTVRREPQASLERQAVTSRGAKGRRPAARPGAALGPLIDQLQDLEDRGVDGSVTLPDGDRLEVSNLKKVFWRDGHVTKGELLRYYVRVSPVILPVVADRPLVMKRLPNGITGKAFYQQRAPDAVPPGVRVEPVPGDTEVPTRLVGGSLKTLLYMTQLAAISQDPWFSRVQTPAAADFAAIDLDPMPDVPFTTVLDVARWIRDELQAIGVAGLPKTSGADGLHIYVRLPPDTPYEAGMLFCQIVATIVATKHPKQATVERTVRARGSRVYVDYLQNIQGKTLACAYSARASEYAGASTPLSWKEVDAGVDRRDFTIRTLPARLKKVGDLWAALREGPPVDLRAVERYLVR
jgi:bifunctional non-homologous end joining protein LigD